MENNEMFYISYDDVLYEIPKSEVEFIEGYGVVTYEVNKNSNLPKYSISGVVDEDFNTVLDFEKYYTDIRIFPDGNFITNIHIEVFKPDAAYDKYRMHQYRVTIDDDGNEKAKLAAEFNIFNYDIINETTIQINSIFKTFLYNVVDREVISENYCRIGEFKKVREDLDERLAKAKARIHIDGVPDSYYLIGYINESGEIRSNLYNTFSKTFIDTSGEDFDLTDTVVAEYRKMRQCIQNERNADEILISNIEPKKETGKTLVRQPNFFGNNPKTNNN